MIGEKMTMRKMGKNRTLGCCICSATPYSILAVLYSSIALPPTSFRIKEEENHEVLCRSKSSSKLKKLVPKVLRTNSMKNLFKSKKPRSSGDVVRETRDLLSGLNSGSENANQRHDEKLEEQLDTAIRELKTILYGINESEPQADAVRASDSRVLQGWHHAAPHSLPAKIAPTYLQDATQVIANLQRQPVHSRLIASDYIETNLDLIDKWITGYEDPVLALHFGGMLKECISGANDDALVCSCRISSRESSLGMSPERVS